MTKIPIVRNLMIACILAALTQVAAEPVFRVEDCGARADGKTLDTAAINKAIEECAAKGGGTVVFTSGTYLSGSIHLRSNVALMLEEGAVILGAPNDIKAYDPPEPNPWDKYQDFGHSHFRNALIWGEGVENVTISGKGIIRGGGIVRGEPKEAGGGDKAISLKECKNVTITDISILQGGHFAILATGCENLTIANLTIRTPRDGINLVGCRNVDVNNCLVRALRFEGASKETFEGDKPVGGDDAIAIKSDYSLGRKLLSENIRVRNCRLATSRHALQFGSETVGDFRNIEFSDIIIDQAALAGISITSNDGAVVDGVTYNNITMTKAGCPIFINITRRMRAPEQGLPGQIKNITLNNITATDVFGYIKDRQNSCIISGLPGRQVSNVVLNNVKITFKGGGKKEETGIFPGYPEHYTSEVYGRLPSYGFYVRHANNIAFRNVTLGFENPDLRPAFLFEYTKDIVLDKCQVQRAPESDCDVLLRSGVEKFAEGEGSQLKVKKSETPAPRETPAVKTKKKGKTDAAKADESKPWLCHVIDGSSRGADGVKLADVNRDGLPDIAVGWEEGDITRVYLNPGLGKTGSAWPFVTVGRTPSVEDAVFADMDGDGAADVVSCCTGETNTVFIHWAPARAKDYMTASAWRQEAIPASKGLFSWMFAVPVQVDGLNGIDLIAGGKGKGAEVGWFESPKNPRDAQGYVWHPLVGTDKVMSLIPLDADGDGDLDIFVSGPGKDGCRWLENPGLKSVLTREWKKHSIGGGDFRALFATVADLDKDGMQDVVSATSQSFILFLKRLDRSGDSWRKCVIPFPNGYATGKGVAVGDINGDGRMDIVGSSTDAYPPKPGVFWLSYQDQPTDSKWVFHDISGPGGIKYDLLELVDMDGDGDLDVLTTEENTVRDKADEKGLGVIWYENPYSKTDVKA